MANVGEIETDGVLRRCVHEEFRTLVVLFRRPLRMSAARAGRLPLYVFETSSMGAFTAYQCGGPWWCTDHTARACVATT